MVGTLKSICQTVAGHDLGVDPQAAGNSQVVASATRPLKGESPFSKGEKKQQASFRRSLRIALSACRVNPDDRRAALWVERRVVALRHNRQGYLLWLKSELQALLRDCMAGISWPSHRRNQIIPPWITRFCRVIQWCKLRRSLPRLIPNDQALIDDLVNRLTTPPELSAGSEMWAFSLFGKTKLDDGLSSDWISSSATSTSSRRDGGMLKDLSLMDSSGIFESEMEVDNPSTMFPLYKKRGGNHSYVSVIYELGLKTRLVTRQDFLFTASAQRIRRAIFKKYILKDGHDCLNRVFRDPDCSELTFRMRGKSLKIFSGDFSKATDTLLFSFLDRMCTILDLDPRLVHKDMYVNGFKTVVGAFMGLPGSWSLLDLAVFICCAEVDRTFSFYIKGDDVIALWTQSQIDKFCRLARENTGLIVNDKTVISSRFGTFAEMDFQRVENRGRLAVLKRLPTFSLRVFMEGSLPDFQFWNSAVNRGCSVNLLCSLTYSYCAAWMKAARFHKIPIFAPRFLGGLGLPTDRRRPLGKGSLCMIQIMHNYAPKFLDIDRPYNSDGWARIVLTQYQSIDWEYRPDEVYTDSRFEKALGKDLSDAVFTDAANGKMLPKKRPLRPSESCKRMSRYRRKVLKSGSSNPNFTMDIGGAMAFESHLIPDLELEHEQLVAHDRTSLNWEAVQRD